MSFQTTIEPTRLLTFTRHIPLLFAFCISFYCFNSRMKKIFAQHAHESGSEPQNWSTTRKNPLASQPRPSAWRKSGGVSGIGSAWFPLVSFWYWLEQCRLLIIRRRDSLYTYTLLICDSQRFHSPVCSLIVVISLATHYRMVDPVLNEVDGLPCISASIVQ
jgi:hypothetical protein